MNSLTVDDLSFEVRRSTRRKSVQITVDRGGELILTAPESCPPAKMVSFVREKKFWIYTKLAQKDALDHAVPKKSFANGEGFPYLGRSYRLLLVRAKSAPVKLDHGRFRMQRAAVSDGRAHMIRWYSERAKPWLTERVERFRRRVGVEPGEVHVQELGFRWGSCGKGGRLNFHWRTILLPPSIVEYVVVHELVHLLEPHHTPKFWRRVERVMPDYEQRKARLKELGAGLEW